MEQATSFDDVPLHATVDVTPIPIEDETASNAATEPSSFGAMRTTLQQRHNSHPSGSVTQPAQPAQESTTNPVQTPQGGAAANKTEHEAPKRTPLGPSIHSGRSIRSASKRQPAGSRIGAVYRHSGPTIYAVQSARSLGPEVTRLPVTDEDEVDATWHDVCVACCCHTPSEWVRVFVVVLVLFAFLYFFLVGLDFLGTSFRVVGGCTAGTLLGDDTNPLAAVLIGLFATALLHSSATTIAIIVSLVSGGLDVKQGIYMVMGANVGTSVTPLLVALAHMGDGEELERAFAASSLLFIFNFMTLAILFPLEITTGYLYAITKPMLPDSVGEGESWEGPVRTIVNPLVKKLIIANKKLIEDISTGAVESCSLFYPVTCVDGIVSYDTCTTGVISCDEDTGDCPAFFQDGASKQDDMVSGWVCLIIALTILIICLLGLVVVLHMLLAGASTRIIYKATSINPYLAMVIGCGVTILVQSSSVTVSTLVPLAGVGVLKMEDMYPLVLGADIGTTTTALLAAMVSSKVESLQIALTHVFFNLTGATIWFPLPFMRSVILRIARWLGKITRHWRAFPILFILVVFYLLPLVLLGISACFESKTKGYTALGVFLLLLVLGGLVYFWFWWSCRSGNAKCRSCIERRQRRAAAIAALADDMDYLKVDSEWCKNEIGRLKDFAGVITVAATPPLTMEEGSPVDTVLPPQEEEYNITEEEERLSTFESCRSKPWKDILYLASGSIKSGLQGSMRSQSRFAGLQGSIRSQSRYTPP